MPKVPRTWNSERPKLAKLVPHAGASETSGIVVSMTAVSAIVVSGGAVSGIAVRRPRR